MGTESRNENDPQKMSDKGHHTIYTDWISLQHCWILLLKQSKNTLIEQSPALKSSIRAVENVLLTIPPETHTDSL